MTVARTLVAGSWWSRWPRAGRRMPVIAVLRAMWRVSPGGSLLSAVLLAGVTALSLTSIMFSGQLIDHVETALRRPGPAADRAAWWSLASIGVVLLAQELVASLLWPLMADVARDVEGRVRGDVMRAVLARSDITHLSLPEVRSSIDAATTVGTARYGPGFAVEGLVPVIGGLLTGCAMAGLLSTQRWWLGPLMVLVWLVARSFVHRERMELLRVYAHQVTATRRFSYFRNLALRPQAAKEIRIFGLQTWLVEGFTSFWGSVMLGVWSGRRKHLTTLARLGLLVLAAHVVVVLVVVHDFSRGDLSVGRLVILLQALLGTSAINLADSGNGDAHVEWGGATVVASDRLTRELRAGEEKPAGLPAPRPRSRIDLTQISYRYPGRRNDVLSGLDLTVEVGRSLALVGENGAGKTTLVKLLAGLVPPTDGAIRVDGTDLVNVDLDSWHQHFAVVFQDFLRLPVSMIDNVTAGRYDESEAAALDDVADRAGLGDILARLPQGWLTPLTRELTGGVDLSGGEWQRVALARALWSVHRGATLLVLDEPTAALDVQAEARFYENFLDITRGLTTLVISHRFSTVRRAGRIAVLSAGVVSELGSHDELLASGGDYARYFRLQADVFTAEPTHD